MELGLPLMLFRRASDLFNADFLSCKLSHTYSQVHTQTPGRTQLGKRNGFSEVLFVVRWHCPFAKILKANLVPWLNAWRKQKD